MEHRGGTRLTVMRRTKTRLYRCGLDVWEQLGSRSFYEEPFGECRTLNGVVTGAGGQRGYYSSTHSKSSGGLAGTIQAFK